MTLERKIARIFRLTDENWMKHANPWSVWTRYSVLPILVLAIWSRVWLGWWSLTAIAISVAWMFFNPIFFPKPSSTRNWASRSVLGERVYLNRDKVQIPDIHASRIFSLLNAISFMGLMMAIWAAVYYSLCGAILGVSFAYLAKSWYLDRMVWLYTMMKNEIPEYRAWDY